MSSPCSLPITKEKHTLAVQLGIDPMCTEVNGSLSIASNGLWTSSLISLPLPFIYNTIPHKGLCTSWAPLCLLFDSISQRGLTAKSSVKSQIPPSWSTELVTTQETSTEPLLFTFSPPSSYFSKYAESCLRTREMD